MKSGLLAAVAVGGLLLAGPAMAQGVKIGILNDQSGVYADYGGKWSVEAAKMAIADFGGSWKFIIANIIFFIFWVILNTLLIRRDPFDPYPFVLLNLVLGMITGLQAPIIMMSQNRQAEKDRLRADLDYQVNLKNEMVLGEILRRVERRDAKEKV